MTRIGLAGMFAMLLAASAYAGTVNITDSNGNTLTGTTSDSATIGANGAISITGLSVTNGCLGDCGAPAPGTPACTLAASPASITDSGTTNLVASCSNFTPTSYAWTEGGSAKPSCANLATCTSDTLTSTTAFTVTASDGSGNSANASKTVTVTASAQGGSTSCTDYPPVLNASGATSAKMQVFAKPSVIYYDTISAGTVQPYAQSNTGAVKGSITVISTPGIVRMWISPCPGQAYSTVPSSCVTSKPASSKTLYVSSDGSLGCNVGNGSTFYLNIENYSSYSTGIQGSLATQ